MEKKHKTAHFYYGKQTKKALENFQISSHIFPFELIEALAIVKKAALNANLDLGELKTLKAKEIKAIETACDEVIAGELNDNFSISVWQSGSGTQTNMNVNEVIATRANEILKSSQIHPNDHVNRAQSTNDVFPTAMHIVTIINIKNNLIPALKNLKKSFDIKAKKWNKIIKVGRTHLQDATPMSVGQEFSGYVQQLSNSILQIENTLKELFYIPIGGTAVGTGLNTKKGFDKLTVKNIAKETKLPFKVAPNKFALMAAHDGFVAVSGSLKRTACALIKIANDIRLLSSGPNTGIHELKIAKNEQGSSIMPGKVNPTQVESLTMLCTKVIGNDTTISIAGSQGHLELNVFKPLIIHTILESIELLSDGINSFREKCIDTLSINKERVGDLMDSSLMLVTALNNTIGYEKGSKIANKAYKEKISLIEAATKLKFLTKEEFEKIVVPKKMIEPR